MIIGIALGTFDLYHPGHVLFFHQCKAKCDFLVVAVNTDEFAARYKRKPIMALAERKLMVGSCEHVDRTIVNFGCEDSAPAILESKASLIFHGDDWQGEPLLRQLGITLEWCDKHGAHLSYVPYTPGVSSSQIERRILDERG